MADGHTALLIGRLLPSELSSLGRLKQNNFIINVLKKQFLKTLQARNTSKTTNKTRPKDRFDKTNKMNVGPAKTQISLGIRPV